MATVGTALLGGACLLLSQVSVRGSLGLVLIALFVFGAGMGAVAVCAQIAALTGVAKRDSGLAAGLVDTSFTRTDHHPDAVRQTNQPGQPRVSGYW